MPNKHVVCEVCNRPECRASDAARKADTVDRDPSHSEEYLDRLIHELEPLIADCHAHRVDWRVRCLAAEEKILDLEQHIEWLYEQEAGEDI